MTTKLEQKFFEAFNIPECDELQKEKYCHGKCEQCYRHNYPTITDSIVLRLICILNCKVYYKPSTYRITEGKTLDELINNVLKECIQLKDEIREEVQQLFKD